MLSQHVEQSHTLCDVLAKLAAATSQGTDNASSPEAAMLQVASSQAEMQKSLTSLAQSAKGAREDLRKINPSPPPAGVILSVGGSTSERDKALEAPEVLIAGGAWRLALLVFRTVWWRVAVGEGLDLCLRLLVGLASSRG